MATKDWVLLYTLNDEHEAAIIKSILEAEQIAVLQKYRDIGDYLKIYMGKSLMGVDLPDRCVFDLFKPALRHRVLNIVK